MHEYETSLQLELFLLYSFTSYKTTKLQCLLVINLIKINNIVTAEKIPQYT